MKESEDHWENLREELKRTMFGKPLKPGIDDLLKLQKEIQEDEQKHRREREEQLKEASIKTYLQGYLEGVRYSHEYLFKRHSAISQLLILPIEEATNIVYEDVLNMAQDVLTGHSSEELFQKYPLLIPMIQKMVQESTAKKDE